MQELVFSQFKQGYRYNSDSLLLFDFVLKQRLKGRLLDMGCGCGIIGLMLKAFVPQIKLVLLDIVEQNCALARKNAEQNELEAEVLCVDFKEFIQRQAFDIIVSNPPFYSLKAMRSQDEHKNMAKFQDSLNLKDFIHQASLALKPQGKLYFCYEALALAKIVQCLSEFKLNLSQIQSVHKSKDDKARLLLIEARKGSKAPCAFLAPFCMYENGILSPQMKALQANIRIKSNDI
ncbi:methyltransferase [Campylobacter sp. MIT 12-8780]|uniref:tRNA1(Val) (adenine(37)-N6)-methyltransferase n=1 Tax=unclassified Campylobacter TaxID=2593542 RepID=UPI00115D35DE|nr:MULTISPECIES: methyltransferase [unclassified Campylobacter]NDJ26856.1 methyltransferase [Campylobacter sp. MIT 19-121]TQR41998.1 methyltransferase [Campylobacter sp. MIT 12-8780]